MGDSEVLENQQGMVLGHYQVQDDLKLVVVVEYAVGVAAYVVVDVVAVEAEVEIEYH